MTHRAEPHADCKGTKQSLRDSDLKVTANCPMCLAFDPQHYCFVANHPNEATSTSGMSIGLCDKDCVLCDVVN